jgi:hypothetical protein
VWNAVQGAQSCCVGLGREIIRFLDLQEIRSLGSERTKTRSLGPNLAKRTYLLACD